MVMIEIDRLPGYPTKPVIPLTIDEDGNQVEGSRAYPIPDFEIVSENSISIVDKTFNQIDHKLEMKLIHFLYGPEVLSNRFKAGVSAPRLFLKETFRNNWIDCSQYGNPITTFTSDIKFINTEIKNQMIFKQTHVVDMQHPYFKKISEVSKVLELNNWPWVTLELSIREVRKGDLILNQIQLYEIDLDMKYYIEVDDITPFTAYQLTN